MRSTGITSGNRSSALPVSNTRRRSYLPLLLLLLALLGSCRSERAVVAFRPISSARNTAATSQQGVAMDSTATITAVAKRQDCPNIGAIEPAAKSLPNSTIPSNAIAVQPLTHLKTRTYLSSTHKTKTALKDAVVNHKRQRHNQPTVKAADNWDKLGYFLLCAILGLLLIIIGLITSSLPVALIGLGIGVLGAILFLH